MPPPIIVRFVIVALQVRVLTIPRFEDYRVPTPIPERKSNAFIATHDGPNEAPEHFNKRISEVAKEGPDFAGHYAVVRWSCGSNCESIAIVDIRTRKVYEAPFMDVTGGPYVPPDELLSYELDSSLLIVKGSTETAQTVDKGPWGTFYYRWDGRRLILIRAIPAPRYMKPDP
jgi:hypothetical protein